MTKAEISYLSLDTPPVLVDMDKLEGNIKEMSRLAAGAGVRLRPHTKIHESARIARIQAGEGACGVENPECFQERSRWANSSVMALSSTR